MSFTVPTFEAIRNQYLQAVVNQNAGASIGPDSDHFVRASAVAAVLEGVYSHKAWVFRQAFPDLADADYMERQANLRGLTRKAAAAYDGHHVQIAVADFSGVHRRLLERGLVSEESSQSQYRFENITDLDSAEVLVTLEHEVRSMRHPLYARALVNRNPATNNNHYATGHESTAWQLPPG